ncbi:MAG: lactate dehydrogenase [Bacteroidetes bacterium RIFOXYB2_FULL_35_7]|nr:MAG: lactate dehydrogenase [Bacteroidetes bacterium GWF2_35_48]OFY94326.1 MAG: lactate dehydrogenase [Bacteroidetes bacterium RIFOXYC12_FULL_35_7]OFY97688.1 MAG: lactate dehydrogenase [Bacteroidetes bacterium RIFOXYB2_FULL_35_7]HBX49634.1 lactate dehydrogenase [Bacteroidales bacterium]
MKENVTYISINELEKFTTEVLKGCGMSEKHAKISADVLIAADIRGIDSHGVNRLKPIYYDRFADGIIDPAAECIIIKESPTTVVIDGNNAMGMVSSVKAMNMAIEKAQKYGMGMATVRNSNHFGIAGYYANMAAEKGMIGITGTNARPSVAPTFGNEGMLGTNPLTFVMPSDEAFPFFLDCASSTGQRGKIEAYARINKPTPEGWVVDKNNDSQTDSNEILKGLTNGNSVLLPLGGAGEEGSGYKGYGYATVVEILSAALQGGVFLKALTGMQDGKKVPYRLGHFFIAISIEAFTELDEFKKITGSILRDLRNSSKMPGADRIYTAGEKEYLTMLERTEKGVPVNFELLEELKIMAKELHIIDYSFL